MIKDKDIENIKKALDKNHQKTIALSDDLAANPEISFEEFESSKKIVEILRDGGYKVEYPYLGYDTAFRGVFENGDGPSVAILVEYDALRDIGHGCGHNLHGSLAVLAGLTMLEIKDSFKGKVYVIGTPGEEDDGAKIGMADQGAFDEMDLAIMIHSWSGGENISNMDLLSMRGHIIKFHGQTAHSVGSPWEGKNALSAARKFLDLIDARRECFEPNVYVNSVISDGGKFPNIIPDFAEVLLELRTDSAGKLEKVDDMVIKCMEGAAMALDCKVTRESLLSDFADMVRVKALEDGVEESFKALGQKVIPVPQAKGSSDMGNVSYRCPSIQALISINDESFPLHTREMAKATTLPQGHESIATGANVIVQMCLKIFNDEAYRKKVYEEFVDQRDLKKKI